MWIVPLLAGAIVGVIADRLWRRFEQRPKIKLHPSFFVDISDAQGFTYRVTNLGAHEIPEFDLVLFHPDRGSLGVFESSFVGPLRPSQTQDHRCTLLNSGEPASWHTWFYRQRGVEVESVEFRSFYLRVVMKHSARILLESEPAGNMLAEMMVRTFENRSFANLTWEEDQRLCVTPMAPIAMIQQTVVSAVSSYWRRGRGAANHENEKQ